MIDVLDPVDSLSWRYSGYMISIPVVNIKKCKITMHERINIVCAVWSDLTVHQISDLHQVSPQIKISTPRGIFLFLNEWLGTHWKRSWLFQFLIYVFFFTFPTTIAFDFLNNLAPLLVQAMISVQAIVFDLAQLTCQKRFDCRNAIQGSSAILLATSYSQIVVAVCCRTSSLNVPYAKWGLGKLRRKQASRSTIACYSAYFPLNLYITCMQWHTTVKHYKTFVYIVY